MQLSIRDENWVILSPNKAVTKVSIVNVIGVRFIALIHRISVLLFVCAAITALAGCGNGGSGGGGNAPGDFTLAFSTSNVTIEEGKTATISVTVNAVNGFNSTVSIAVLGLPSGITSSPLGPRTRPGSPITLSFSASSSAATGQVNVTVTGLSGALSHSSQFALNVKPLPVPAPSFHTRYVRTDSATEYFMSPISNWMVFDPATRRFFVTDPSGNQIQVLNATNQAKIGSIAVPGAYGIDETPDGSLLYVGTEIGDVYAIDPRAMKVTRRYPAAQIGPGGYPTYSVRVLANGALALLGDQGGVPGIDGFGSVALWNPSTNALHVHAISHIGAFTLTGDRSLIVVGSLLSPGGFFTLDPTTGQTACAGGSDFPNIQHGVVTTPDGKSILAPVYSPDGIAVFDARTLTHVTTFPVAGDVSSAASMIVSPDSKTLYMLGDAFLYAYDIASGAQLGWLPIVNVKPLSGGFAFGPIYGPNLQAFDNTGLLAGPMEEGVGFLDLTALKTGPVGSGFLNDYLVPATGPAAGGTATEWKNLSPAGVMGAAYFGGNPAPVLSTGTGEFFATTPSGVPGPVDLYAVMEDGGTLIAPEAFSYGPTILQVTPDTATADGGGIGIIYGYGFGPTADNAQTPSDLQVTVDGKTATILGFAPNGYGLLAPPFNMQAVAYAIPAGLAGSKSDVTLSTVNGTARASGALNYLPAVQQFTLSGAALAQGIYDAKRGVYYFTDASEIQVFSRTEGKWLTPIQVPAPPAGTTHRLWGTALSPNGGLLAVSDLNASVIYLINPDSSGSAQSFGSAQYGAIASPTAVAVSDSGSLYFAGTAGYFNLDTTTGKLTSYGDSSGGTSRYNRLAISFDNSRVFFNHDGGVFSVDTISGAENWAAVSPGCCYGDQDLALSSDQSTFEATGYLYDLNLNAKSYLAMNDREVRNRSKEH